MATSMRFKILFDIGSRQPLLVENYHPLIFRAKPIARSESCVCEIFISENL